VRDFQCLINKNSSLNELTENKRIRRRRRIFNVWLKKSSSPNGLNENKRIRRMRGMKLSALGEYAE
jgi:hypothetical protein